MPKKAFRNTNFPARRSFRFRKRLDKQSAENRETNGGSPRIYEDIRLRLLKHRVHSIQKFEQNHPHAVDWFKNRRLDLANLRLHSQKLMSLSSLTATLLLSAPQASLSLPPKTSQVLLAEHGIQTLPASLQKLRDTLAPLVPHRIGHLDPTTETTVTTALRDILGITASSTLEGQHLNHSLGWIGYEQHLLRYPGDAIDQHDAELASGVAPHTGAWGFFATSKTEFTETLKAYEQYYVAVQTLYLPTWGQDTRFLSEWFKHRKVIVINTENGRVVVAVIGDAGPAAWTGKQFGGSPEVMRALDLTGKKSKGKVLLLFVNDPENQVPLGPIEQPINQDIKLT